MKERKKSPLYANKHVIFYGLCGNEVSVSFDDEGAVQSTFVYTFMTNGQCVISDMSVTNSCDMQVEELICNTEIRRKHLGEGE